MARRLQQLFTIGYSGHTLDTFIEVLQTNNVSMLVDIRMTPISRKRGFSKTALHRALEDAGIAYRHIRTLGSPSELRRDLHRAKDYSAFFESFREYLQSQQDDISCAAQLVTTQRVCLMCVEQCPDECHRSVVAEAIARSLPNHVIVEHLPVPSKTAVRTKAAVSPTELPLAGTTAGLVGRTNQ